MSRAEPPIRQAEFTELCARIRSSASSSVLLIGDYGSGKTSLITEVTQWASDESKVIPSRMDAGRLPELSHRAFWQAGLRPVDACTAGRWHDGRATFLAAHDDGFSHHALEELFSGMQRAGLRLALLVDEFQELLRGPLERDFWGSLRSLMGHYCSALIVVGATAWPYAYLRERLPQIKDGESPFLNVMTIRTIGALPRAVVDARVLHLEPGSTQDERALIWRFAGGNLRLTEDLVQPLGHAKAVGARPRVEAAIASFCQDAGQAYFEYLWRPWPPDARFVALRVALDHLRDVADAAGVADVRRGADVVEKPERLIHDLFELFASMLGPHEVRLMLLALGISNQGAPGEQTAFGELLLAALNLANREGLLPSAVAYVHGKRPRRQKDIQNVLSQHGVMNWISGELPEIHVSELHGLDLRGILVRVGAAWRIQPLLVLRWFAEHKLPAARNAGQFLHQWLQEQGIDASPERVAFCQARLPILDAVAKVTDTDWLKYALQGEKGR